MTACPPAGGVEPVAAAHAVYDDRCRSLLESHKRLRPLCRRINRDGRGAT